MNQQQQKTSFTITLIYAALLFSTIVYLIVAFMLSRIGWKPLIDPALAQMLMGIFLALSLIDVMFVSWLKKKSFNEEISGIQAGDTMRKFIVSKSVVIFALCEIPALLGLTIFFLSGSLIMAIVFWTLSLIAFLIARPPKEILDKADSMP
jgi:membrane protease YdiL (CAAX protease family)